MTSKPKTKRRRAPTATPANKRSKVGVKLGSKPVENRIVMGREAAEDLEYNVSKDWRETLRDPDNILPLFSQEALMLLSHATPIYLRIDGFECILRHTQNTGWVLLPEL